MQGEWIEIATKIVGIVCMAFFVLTVAVQLVRYFCLATGKKRVAGVRLKLYSARGGRLDRRFWLELLAAFILSRLLILAVCTLYAGITGGVPHFFQNFWTYWCRWDGDHYIGLIKNWYVTEGDARLHLAFFPLYPLVCRGLYLLGVPAPVAALGVSNLALLGCGAVLGLLTAERYDEKAAHRAMWLLMFCPVTFFFSMPYTESLFLLVSLIAVWMAVRKRYVLAVLFGALAANARMVGMTVAIPIFWEMVHDAWAAHVRLNGHEAKRTDAEFLKRVGLCVLKVLPVLAGLLAYFALNYSLHGNPFQFLIYQRENWHQEMGSLAGTIGYTLPNAISYKMRIVQFGVWIPQILTIFAMLILMAKQWRRQHPGDAAYALVYFYLSVAPTWLVSGTRYMGAMYALYPMLAMLLPRKRFAAAFVLELALMCYMTVIGVNIGYVL